MERDIKSCKKCGEAKPLALFVANRNTCKSCATAAARDYRKSPAGIAYSAIYEKSDARKKSKSEYLKSEKHRVRAEKLKNDPERKRRNAAYTSKYRSTENGARKTAEYRKKYQSSPSAKLSREKYSSSEKGKSTIRAYLTSEIGRLNRRANAEKHKDRHSARSKVKYALSIGRLEKLPCWVCGAANSEAHHADYSAPLAVTWLCDKHHKETHKMANELRRKAAAPLGLQSRFSVLVM